MWRRTQGCARGGSECKEAGVGKDDSRIIHNDCGKKQDS